MDCPLVANKLSGLLDGQIAGRERATVETHLQSCAPCAESWEEYRAIRSALRASPGRRIPVSLEWNLRVMASREASRRRRALAGMLEEWFQRSMRLAGELLRPLAIPAAGGVFSAVILLGTIMTNFSGVVHSHPKDVPTILSTEAEMVSSPPVSGDTEYLILEVLVDEQGRAVDYSIPATTDPRRLAALKRQIEIALRYAQFKPATQFGQPVMGWLKVTFASSLSSMDVQG
jgi:negative regulator of sigma E activity